MVGDVRIDAILFDLDGVLVDACDWHYEALNAALVGAGHPPIGRETHLSTFNGLPTRKKLEMLGISYGEAIEINRQKQKHTLDIIQTSATIMSEKIELHTLDSMITCINLYLPKLNDGGVLIIEDVQSTDWISHLHTAATRVFKDEMSSDVFDISVVDLRQTKGRYDDLMFIIRKKTQDTGVISE
jgi:hypothetical protein